MSAESDNRSNAGTACLRRWGFVIVAAAASVAAAQTSVPPAEYRPAPAHKAEAATALRLPAGAHVRRIALPQPTAAEAVAPKAATQTGGAAPLLRNKAHRLALGFARAVPPADRSLPLRGPALADHRRGNAGRAARADVAGRRCGAPGAGADRRPAGPRRALPGLGQRRAGLWPVHRCRHRRRSRLLVTGTGRRNRHHRARVARGRRAGQRAARIADAFPPQRDRPEPARVR